MITPDPLPDSTPTPIHGASSSAGLDWTKIWTTEEGIWREVRPAEWQRVGTRAKTRVRVIYRRDIWKGYGKTEISAKSKTLSLSKGDRWTISAKR
jgi:hypothetical protein